MTLVQSGERVPRYAGAAYLILELMQDSPQDWLPVTNTSRAGFARQMLGCEACARVMSLRTERPGHAIPAGIQPQTLPHPAPALAPLGEAPTQRAAHQEGGDTPSAKVIPKNLLSSATVLLHAALQLFDTVQQEQGQAAMHEAHTRASQLKGPADGLAARIGSMDQRASLFCGTSDPRWEPPSGESRQLKVA